MHSCRQVQAAWIAEAALWCSSSKLESESGATGLRACPDEGESSPDTVQTTIHLRCQQVPTIVCSAARACWVFTVTTDSLAGFAPIAALAAFGEVSSLPLCSGLRLLPI